MASDVRSALLEMGLPDDDIDKAEKHFGSKLETQTAVTWIFDGMPGYVAAQNTQVVPYAGPQVNNEPSQQPNNAGWVKAYEEHATANAMLGLKDTSGNDTMMNTDKRYRSDSIITQPAHDPWQMDPADMDRPYSKLPPAVEDVHIPTIVTDLGGDTDMSRTSAPRTSPVDMASTNTQDNGEASGGKAVLHGPQPEEDVDADLKRAIELSLQESSAQGGASADMSRAASRSRQQQEEAEFTAALSQSIVLANQHATASTSLEQDPLLTHIRENPDIPVIISSPSSFLSYLPSVLQSFYFNPIFRKVILEIDGNFSQPPSYAKYYGQNPVLTRSIVAPDTPDHLIKLLALQRLFVYLKHSQRSKTDLADIMDAFNIPVPNTAKDRNPLGEMRAFHDQISEMWTQYILKWHQDQLEIDTMTMEDIQESESEVKRILLTQGIVIPEINEEALDAELDNEYIMDNHHAKWSNYAWVQSIYPGLNDTYSTLDEYFINPTHPALVLRPGLSLYIYNTRLPRAGTLATSIGPALPSYALLPDSNDDTPKPFQVEPVLFLDRYDWSNRREILLDIRGRYQMAQSQLSKLIAQREKLLTSSKAGTPLVDAASLAIQEPAAGETETPSDSKAILQQAVIRLEELASTLDDPERQKSQLLLVEKLKTIISLMQNQISKLNAEIAKVQQDIKGIREITKKEIGPYELRTVTMWNGFIGRESLYTYVRSGVATADIDGSKIEHPKWWKVSEGSVFEVSQEVVCSDKTGLLMSGAGAIAQSYVLQSQDDTAELSIPKALVDAIQADNDQLKREVEKQQSTAEQAKEADMSAASEGVAMDSNPTEAPNVEEETSDETMQTDELAKEITEQPSLQPLDLRGGASSRRLSVTSDTGSIASTSRVRIDDWDDENVSESTPETVELGFPVKMKKGFKVVKDVGKLGGKPTWLDPALPLKPDMVTCETCKCRMEFLLQMNCPLDELPQAIYRTFYVYTCRKASCLKNATSQGVKVFRVQLPDKNPYYDLSDEAAQSRAQKFRDKQYAELCPTCKMKHSDECTAKPWTEWLIETGAEDVEDEDVPEIDPDDIEERIKNATLYQEDHSTADAKEPDTRTAVDAAFLKFQERLYNEPDQIMRYYYREAENEPLWVSDEKKSRPTNISKCVCGAERKCEFQIMPPILSILGVNDLEKDSLDFGTILVYTCQDSCTVGKPPPDSVFEGEFAVFTPLSGWAEEVGFVQNFTQQGVKL